MLTALLLALPAISPPMVDRSPEVILREIRARGNAAPTTLFEELAAQQSAEALEALIKGIDAISKVEKVCSAYKSIAGFRDAGPLEARAVEYLASSATRNQEQLALHAVWQLGSLWPTAKPALFELAMEHDTADGRSFALMHLVDHGMPLTNKELSQLARSKDDAVRYEALLTRGRSESDSSDSLAKRLRSRDAVDRLVGVERLRSSALPQRFEWLQSCLDDEDGRVRRKSIDVLENTRTRAALEILIERLSHASRGERFRISGALERLTAQHLGTQADRWQRWWKQEGAQFQFPDESGPLEAGPATEASRDKTTSSFYGLPIYAEQLVFAIDSSRSMSRAAQGDQGPSRMDVAKRELSRAIEGLGEDSSFDVVDFGKSAWSWKGQLVRAKSKNKKLAIEHVAQLDLTLGTEIYRALREAYRDPQADTILFLTDGDPQLSLMQDRGALKRIVAQWNRTRHTSIDCLTIGTERKWLRELAELTRGRYQRID